MNVEVFCDCYRFPAYELPELTVDDPPRLSCMWCGRIAYAEERRFQNKNNLKR